MSDNQMCSDICRRPVECSTCHRTKAPRGRSVPMEAASGYCNYECRGYADAPAAGHLWPSELIGDEREPTDDDEERA